MGSVDAWQNLLHKDNAAFTIAGWYRFGVTASGQQSILSTFADTVATIGVAFGAADNSTPPYTAGKLYIDVGNGSGSFALAKGSSTLSAVPTGSDVFVALSVDEAGNAGIFHMDGVSETFAAAYSSPTASAATFGIGLIQAGADPSVGAEVLSRMYNAAFWQRALSSAELISLYNATKRKYGL